MRNNSSFETASGQPYVITSVCDLPPRKREGRDKWFLFVASFRAGCHSPSAVALAMVLSAGSRDRAVPSGVWRAWDPYAGGKITDVARGERGKGLVFLVKKLRT